MGRGDGGCKGGGLGKSSAGYENRSAPGAGRGKGGGKKGDDRGSSGYAGAGPPPPRPDLPTEPGKGICWNPADRDDTLVFLGRPLLRVRRSQAHTKWSGCRATMGIASGRGAFAIKNETGGNMRLGWSLGDATLDLGMDDKSFGFGGIGTKSHAGQYKSFGQSYGKDDVVVAMIDLERHAITYMKNGHVLPGDAFALPRHFWGLAFFPHVLTKEATITTHFGGQTHSFDVPTLPAGFSWLADLTLVRSQRQCDHSAVDVEDPDASVEVDFSQLQQTAHREQFEDWKVKVTAYSNHFKPSLYAEYQAEKQSVMQRVKRSNRQLESTGFGCFGLSMEMREQKITFTRPRGIPRLAEISIGRTVLITEEGRTVNIDDPSLTISGEVERVSEGAIIVSTTYDRLPEGKLFRLDLGPNVSTYDRISMVLDRLQSCEKPSKKVRNRMGIVSPCTALADALFADVAETSSAALKWDPSTRPRPNSISDISVAARACHLAVPPRPPAEAAPEPRALNDSQQYAVSLAITEQRCLSLVQGPPGTGKTTAAVEIICSWLRHKRGPIMATAFSNKGVNNLAEGLYKRGVSVLRVGFCDAELPYSMEAHLEYHGYEKGRKGAGKGAQNDVIGKADVICATVIGSGMGLLRNFDFPFVVVDEAAQIIEPACLIPLAKGSVQVVMVGDQCQLPATVLSHEAQRAGLDVSLFDRLISMGMEVHMLSIQYRMHPLIAEFPSWRFYGHKLETGVRPEDRPPLPLQGLDLGTMAIVHVGAAEHSQGLSKSNDAEADCVEYLVRAIKAKCALSEVGVITPYSAQVMRIKQVLRNLGSEAEQVQVSSVDAFQGSEKEAIVLSMVRSNLRGDIGFVADWRRLNVAATRAKRLLVVVGNITTLSQHALWRDFFGHHQDLKVLEWCSRGSTRLGPLSEEPALLLEAAREIARRRGVKPLPLRGDYPVDGDFKRVEQGTLTWDAPPKADVGEDLSWDIDPVAAEGAWGDAPVAKEHGGWGGEALEGAEHSLIVGPQGALLDLAATRWGMLVEGVDRNSPNRFEVGSTISAVDGVLLRQADASEESLDRVVELFGENFRDQAKVRLLDQEERLLPWSRVPQEVDRLSNELCLITEFCPKGLLVYGPACALDLVA